MSESHDNTLSVPKRHAMLLELRTLGDIVKMTAPLLGSALRKSESIDSTPIMVIPGFGSDDRYTAPLRHYLARLGYPVEGWGMGMNLAGTNLKHSFSDLSDRWQVSEPENYQGEGSVPYLVDQVTTHVEQRAVELGHPITLIGWSLGGYIAREVARDLPDEVNQVITLGAPTIGGPKYTAAASFFLKKGMDLDWIEDEIRAREAVPISQPITAIYSKSDAIVSWQAAIDHHSKNVTHIEVKAAHLGMGFNPTIWRHITQALRQHPK